ncbi:Sulfate transporter [Tieghemostelium lacteum]|uniref:Sulfate transporter n=1 Tax=Tieghemostelium lacteum TaxID=361077 RepID=A0A151ZBA1_TIELA|nr:Sulfate transporter [Tieghemostelium lacteum]|eukprot:KYQ91218.1 Sulfate transporter [Tieghemostelium lacteum]
MGDHLKNTREWIQNSSTSRNDLSIEMEGDSDSTTKKSSSSRYLSPRLHSEEEEIEEFITKEELKNPKEAIKAVRTRLPLYLPIVNWIRSYTKQDLIGDLLSSVTVAIMLVPQGLAYAILAGLSPIYGLYSGWLPLVIYSFMGSCKQLAIGPEALLSVLLGSILADFPETENLAEISHSLAFLVGIISFLFGVFQFGFMGGLLSRWVLSGFINAVALIIAISQLDALIGVKFDTHMGPYEKFYEACKRIKEANTYTIVFSVCCIVFLFTMRFVKQGLAKKGFKNAKYIPEIMILVIISILVTYFFRLDNHNLAILGNIKGGFPLPHFPNLKFSQLQALLPNAFLMVVVGFVEATAVSKGLATKHNYQISSNRELVAFGTANILGSMFQTYPVFASIPRTAIQDSAGSRTCLSGFLTSCILLFTCLFLTSLFTYLPKCAMAAIIFVAAFGLLEIHEVQFLWKTRSWGDLTQFTVALLATFILEVELGILISVGMCIFLVLKHSSSPHVYSVLGRVPGTNRFKDVAKFPEAEPIEGILLVRVDEILYFANISQFKQLLSEIEKMMDRSAVTTGSGSTPLQSIIINVVNIPVMDASALMTIQEMVEAYHRRNVKVAFVQMSDKIKDSFKKSGLYDIITPQYIFESNYEAVTFLEYSISQGQSHSNLDPDQMGKQQNLDIPAVRGAFDQHSYDDDDSLHHNQHFNPLTNNNNNFRNNQHLSNTNTGGYNNNNSSSPLYSSGGGAILTDNLKLEDTSDPESDDFITK